MYIYIYIFIFFIAIATAKSKASVIHETPRWANSLPSRLRMGATGGCTCKRKILHLRPKILHLRLLNRQNHRTVAQNEKKHVCTCKRKTLHLQPPRAPPGHPQGTPRALPEHPQGTPRMNNRIDVYMYM